jgi:hypothetical protein
MLIGPAKELDQAGDPQWRIIFKHNAAGSIRVACGSEENSTVSATDIFEAAMLEPSVDMKDIAAIFVHLLDQESAELQLPVDMGHAFYENLKRQRGSRNDDSTARPHIFEGEQSETTSGTNNPSRELVSVSE